MPHSMTGYGTESGQYNEKQVTVEIRSLNSKFCDVAMRIPNHLKSKEIELRSLVNKRLERGKIEFSIRIEQSENEAAVSINQDLAKKYFDELNALAGAIDADKTEMLKLVMGMPEVVKKEKEEFDENEFSYILEVVEKAFQKFEGFRSDEGEKLKEDLILRVSNIEENLEKVIAIDDERVEIIKDRIRTNLAKLEDQEVDQNRFEQELIYYIEKLDITEEKVRLKSHLDYFRETIQQNNAGKKLGFIGQEIGREINTMGSKANHAQVQHLVVKMKDELEKIKEQVLNLL